MRVSAFLPRLRAWARLDRSGKLPPFWSENRRKLATIRANRLRRFAGEHSTLIASRRLALYAATVAGLVTLQPARVSAQWWHRAPVDFEECSDAAEKLATPRETSVALVECSAKFAGRRKAGGGYTYYDFMQDRRFDIAGPNPTPEEQKHIDEQYAVYLENQRRSRIAAAFAAKQQEQQTQQTSLRSDAPKVPLPLARPTKLLQSASTDIRPGLKRGDCAQHRFSCEWPRLSEGLNDLKKLFSSQPSRTKRADRS
jgi:hypothetical protein